MSLISVFQTPGSPQTWAAFRERDPYPRSHQWTRGKIFHRNIHGATSTSWHPVSHSIENHEISISCYGSNPVDCSADDSFKVSCCERNCIHSSISNEKIWIPDSGHKRNIAKAPKLMRRVLDPDLGQHQIPCKARRRLENHRRQKKKKKKPRSQTLDATESMSN